MTAAVNLVIEQGTTFNQEIILKDDNGDDLDVTGYTANASLRKTYSSSNVVVFTTSLSNGSLTISLDPGDTTAMTPGRYIWDAILVKAEEVDKIVKGIATLYPTSSHES